jgi:hypothetical protein
MKFPKRIVLMLEVSAFQLQISGWRLGLCKLTLTLLVASNNLRVQLPRLHVLSEVESLLLVGIGACQSKPTMEVSKPAGAHPRAIQYDHGKAQTGQFRRKGALAPTPVDQLVLGHVHTLPAHIC